ncbi:hypothetical protein HKD37_14G040387 [Glycine soja]
MLRGKDADDRMEMYIKSTQYRLWLIITNGHKPIPRPEVEWAYTNLVIMELNTKARYTLTCTFSINKNNKKITKEIWDSFSINYEFTNAMFGRLQTLSWDELLGIHLVYEVHLQNKDHMPKRDFTALKSRETISKKEEKRDPLKLLKFIWLSLMSPKIVVKNPKQ